MRARYAKLIRIGIMYKCLPYLVNPEYPTFKNLDRERLSDFQYDYIFYGNDLSRRAAERTNRWESIRYTS
jgi:hypothetical protein